MSAAEQPMMTLLRDGGAVAVLQAVADELVRRGAGAEFIRPCAPGYDYALVFHTETPEVRGWSIVYDRSAHGLLARLLADAAGPDPELYDNQ